MTPFLRAFGYFVFLEQGVGIDEISCSLPSAAALLVCMPADRKVSARDC